MGDSITEGTIAAVLKQAGEAVNEDEVIAQIETDKVTVDVRAPKTGTLSTVLVKEDETVRIGQTVAHIFPGEAPVEAAAREPEGSAQKPEDGKRVGAEPSAQAKPSRVPGIRFPPRMTEHGERISAMPAGEQEAYLASLEGHGHDGGSAGEPSESAPEKETPLGGSNAPTAAPVRRPAERGDTHPERYPYSDAEMECINLGGAGLVDINVAVNVEVKL